MSDREPTLPPLEQAIVYLDAEDRNVAAATITIVYNPALVRKEVVLACLEGASEALAKVLVDELNSGEGH